MRKDKISLSIDSLLVEDLDILAANDPQFSRHNPERVRSPFYEKALTEYRDRNAKKLKKLRNDHK